MKPPAFRLLLPTSRLPFASIRNIAALTCLVVILAPFADAAGADGGSLSCDVAIVGGGAGGLHTAFRLAPFLGSDVCLFEKEDRLGGRILDVSRTPGGPVFGAGALRVMETQEVLFDLADELGIELEAVPTRDDLVSARGFFGASSGELNALAYPLVPDEVTEGDLYDQLRFGPERERAATYPDFRSYVRAVVGEQGYHFLHEVFRFRGDFQYPLDARGYLDWLDEEWDTCCVPSYPVGGMSQFIDRMEASARAHGARVFTSEPVLKIRRVHWGGEPRYRLRTSRHRVNARRVVVAVDADGFRHVSGPIARAIQDQSQFRDLIGIKVVTVAQWWPSAWWLDVAPGLDIRRAWTTEHCLNTIEIPANAYSEQQLVTRSVYDDDLRCVEFWETAASRSLDFVEEEIARGLAYLFPDADIPEPLHTHVQVWPAGWYWLRAGSAFTNADIADWALEPLPGERVFLVGDSYNPQRSAWSDAAFKSSIRTLNTHFGFDLPGAETLAGSATKARRGSRQDGR